MPAPHDFAHQLDIDFRLPTPRHSLEKKRRERSELLANGRDRGELLARMIQLERRSGIEPSQECIQRMLPGALLDADEAFLHERGDRRVAGARELQCPETHLVPAAEHVDDLLLLFRQARRRLLENDEAVVTDAGGVFEDVCDRHDAR